MAEVAPRWEWRSFEETFGEAERRFAALPSEQVEESDELYLLSSVADENVKIRAGLMDVKALQQVDANGLQLWKPVMKGAFPLPAAAVAQALGALGVGPLELARAQYTLEQLLGELVEPSGRVRPVAVHKRRARYRASGCLAEVADVTAGGRRTRTVAIESEDPVRVVDLVREFGLSGRDNVSYPRGLKRLIGMKG